MSTDQQDAPNRAVAAYQMANQQFQAGQYQQALTSYNVAINLNPDLAEAYYGRGTVYTALRDFTLALQDANRAITLRPNYALAYYLHGAVSYAIGHIEMAKTNLTLAAELFQKAGNQSDYDRVTGLLDQIIAINS
jgi:tetratricopeptide (TPR) repeat protein